ncbi:MAG: amidohydrolase [Dehalococcoidia bacterium]|nr:amidohydrolase [Dehalococcoidia bacterium]
MPVKAELRKRVCKEIDRYCDEIIAVCESALSHPEPGFKEKRTARLVEDKFIELGIPYRAGLAVTGIKAILKGKQTRPMIAVIGELDSLVIPDHPHADPVTGAAHACGHNAQVAMLIGVATALSRSGVMSWLDGSVALIAAPAEEYIQIEYRQSLRKQGIIEYLGGKAELIRLGEFDDIDMAMMTHTANLPEGKKLLMGGTSNGTIAKQVQYLGKASHAGGSPHQGINALNAATIAMAAINTQRETFKDADTVRVHPIITKGGEAVNIVPADVRMETFVRGKTLDAIKDADRKVDRALRAGALAVGAKVKINTLPGYLPMQNNELLQEVYRQNALRLLGKDEIIPAGTHGTGSTDMGDVAHIMPAVHPMIGGVSGTSHGNDYLVCDHRLAVITPAKIMAMSVIDLLADGATKAKEILEKCKPAMTKAEYITLMNSFLKEEEWQG